METGNAPSENVGVPLITPVDESSVSPVGSRPPTRDQLSGPAPEAVRRLSDDQLAKSGAVFTDAPPMTAEQLVMRGLISHIDEHVGSIRKTVGP